MIQVLHLAPFNRAQRLSASSEFAHPTCASVHEFSNSAQRLSASSEFAHRVYGTHARNEMCSTPFGIIGIRTRGDDDGLRVRFLCSTPFGIIGIRTLVRLSRTEAPIAVLNAFRHHRNSHFISKTLLLLIEFVLNAFRHHRNSHCSSSNVSATKCECSTPFGIIGVRTRSSAVAYGF